MAAKGVPAHAGRPELVNDWLAADIFPPYEREALEAEPLRMHLIGLIAARAPWVQMAPLLDQLEARADSPIDQMLRAEALLVCGEAVRAERLLAELSTREDGLGARAAVLLAQRLMDRGEYVAAAPLVEHAAGLAMQSAGCQIALGYLRDFEGRADAALAHFRRAFATQPRSLAAIGHLVTALLRRGEIREGLETWVLSDDISGIYSQAGLCPVWDGSPLGRDSLMILCGYGLGDIVQFMRFVVWLREREPAARLSILAPPPLQGLLQATGWFESVHVSMMDLADFDWQVTYIRLPLLLGVAAFPDLRRYVPYLSVSPELAAAAATWLPPRRPGVKRVGLRWSGQSAIYSGKRDIPFEQLRPLFAIPGLEWVALVENRVALEGLDAHPMLLVCEHLTGLDATGALLGQLDLTLSADTSVAHLAGALGLPAWVMVRPDPEWRWGEAGSSSPWYDSLRVFRHPTGEFDWNAVVGDVVLALREWAAA